MARARQRGGPIVPAPASPPCRPPPPLASPPPAGCRVPRRRRRPRGGTLAHRGPRSTTDAEALLRGVSDNRFRAGGFGASFVLCSARDDFSSLSRWAFSLVNDRPAVLFSRAAARRDSPTPCTRTTLAPFRLGVPRGRRSTPRCGRQTALRLPRRAASLTAAPGGGRRGRPRPSTSPAAPE